MRFCWAKWTIASLQAFTVTSVELAAGLSSARVFVTPAAQREFQTEGELKRALRALRRASGYLRHVLSQRAELRRVPELHFELDRGMQRGERINTLLERLRKKSKSGLAVVLLACLAGFGRAQATEQPSATRPAPRSWGASTASRRTGRSARCWRRDSSGLRGGPAPRPPAQQLQGRQRVEPDQPAGRGWPGGSFRRDGRVARPLSRL